VWKHPILNLKIFLQRGLRGYSTWDLWNFGDYVVSLNARGLKDFKKDCNGVPLPLKLNEWDDILDEMIRAFEIVDKGDDDLIEKWDGKSPMLEKEMEERACLVEKQREVMKKFFDFYECLWW